MKLSYALFVLQALLDSHGARSQPFSLEGGGTNLGSVGPTKKQKNEMKPSSPQKVNGLRKSKDVEIVPTYSSNRRSLSASRWKKEVTFPQLWDSANGGFRLSLSGDGTFLASAPDAYKHNGKTEVGIVRFFQKQESDGKWEELTHLRLRGNSEYDFFGESVALSMDGTRVAIGAPGIDGANEAAGSEFGSVFVYDIFDDYDSWTQVAVIPGRDAEDSLGTAVALSKDGSIVAIGAYQYGLTAGKVRVYIWKGSGFVQLGQDLDGNEDDFFGFSVALSEDGLVVAIGAPSTGCKPGYVRVYDLLNADAATWTERGSSIDGDADLDQFGCSVDLSANGNILAVGASFAGKARVFQLNDDKEWKQIFEIVEGMAVSGIGTSVSLSPSGSTLAVGAYNTSPVVYTVVDDKWEAVAGSVGNTPGGEVSLSSDGSTIAVGDGWYSTGDVAVYNLNSSPSGSNGDPHCKASFCRIYH
eukprot:scaffold9915_cov110-Cylindrotheca_fusiformis.AAC.3